MPARTVKGSQFAIITDGKRIVVKHVYGAKGKCCRVIFPDGVRIEGRDSAEMEPVDSVNQGE